MEFDPREHGAEPPPNRPCGCWCFACGVGPSRQGRSAWDTALHASRSQCLQRGAHGHPHLPRCHREKRLPRRVSSVIGCLDGGFCLMDHPMRDAGRLPLTQWLLLSLQMKPSSDQPAQGGGFSRRLGQSPWSCGQGPPASHPPTNIQMAAVVLETAPGQQKSRENGSCLSQNFHLRVKGSFPRSPQQAFDPSALLVYTGI